MINLISKRQVEGYLSNIGKRSVASTQFSSESSQPKKINKPGDQYTLEDDNLHDIYFLQESK